MGGEHFQRVPKVLVHIVKDLICVAILARGRWVFLVVGRLGAANIIELCNARVQEAALGYYTSNTPAV